MGHNFVTEYKMGKVSRRRRKKGQQDGIESYRVAAIWRDDSIRTNLQRDKGIDQFQVAMCHREMGGDVTVGLDVPGILPIPPRWIIDGSTKK